ncbi:MAG: hypothetical protein HY925_05175 [Elusimicrobia bacterium]|nr:hypothetical protein [Elusimicrobiota bacterium]
MRKLALAALLAASPAAAQNAADYWLRAYQPPTFSEIWRLTLSVKDFKKSLGKALDILGKKGESMLPLENMAGSEKNGFQQLSYKLPADAAPKAFAALQKLGDVEGLQKNPGIDPAVREEVRTKLQLLKDERTKTEAALRDSPSIRGAVDEIVAHLEAFQKTDEAARKRILFNIQLQQKKP